MGLPRNDTFKLPLAIHDRSAGWAQSRALGSGGSCIQYVLVLFCLSFSECFAIKTKAPPWSSLYHVQLSHCTMGIIVIKMLAEKLASACTDAEQKGETEVQNVLLDRQVGQCYLNSISYI